MIFYQNSKVFRIDQISQKEKTVSTVLVPAILIESLKEKRKEHGKRLSIYLKNLLKMYKTLTHSGMIPDPRKIKTEYQGENLNLKRVSFRAENSDWLALGELALAFGKSRCWMFTFLLQIDIAGLWDLLCIAGLNNAVPTIKNAPMQVSVSLDRELQEFVRSYHIRE